MKPTKSMKINLKLKHLNINQQKVNTFSLFFHFKIASINIRFNRLSSFQSLPFITNYLASLYLGS